MAEKIDLAVVGATGAVGETMLSILAERKFPAANVHALASARSAGKRVEFGNRQLVVQDLESFDFSQVQIGLFSPGASVSKIYAPKAAAAGCIVIDNTSQFRYDDDKPLIVPEVNRHALEQYRKTNIIANPNCSTIQMLLALKPLHDAFRITRVNVCTYQAVSGSGKEAIEELSGQTARLLNGLPVQCDVYPKQIAFNALPHIDDFQDNGYTKEEMKIVWETHKIMGDPSIAVNPTCVRIPVFYGHSEALHIETIEPVSADQARELLSESPGVVVMDEQKAGGYPTAVTESAGTDAVYVGRIRKDISVQNGLNLWVVSDNLRKGAALNSVQIAECLLEDYL
ncbi:MAG: aspartate-semialdehyde dehydrogenase [Granulosicoccus sp.]|nr:aspartate-semialdehyde dehydrogenase [Granulosicoccus sp.]